jgi:putative membrane protein
VARQLIEFVVRWLVLALAVWVAAQLIPGIQLGGWPSTLAVALVLGILNTLLKPLLVILSMPVTILTIGLFLIVINTVLLLLGEWIVDTFTDFQFAIDGIWSAILGAVIISVVTFIVSRFINAERIARDLTRG